MPLVNKTVKVVPRDSEQSAVPAANTSRGMISKRLKHDIKTNRGANANEGHDGGKEEVRPQRLEFCVETTCNRMSYEI